MHSLTCPKCRVGLNESHSLWSSAIRSGCCPECETPYAADTLAAIRLILHVQPSPIDSHAAVTTEGDRARVPPHLAPECSTETHPAFEVWRAVEAGLARARWGLFAGAVISILFVAGWLNASNPAKMSAVVLLRRLTGLTGSLGIFMFCHGIREYRATIPAGFFSAPVVACGVFAGATAVTTLIALFGLANGFGYLTANWPGALFLAGLMALWAMGQP